MNKQNSPDIDQLMAQVRVEVNGDAPSGGDAMSSEGERLPVGEIMRRVRAEIVRRRAGPEASVAANQHGCGEDEFPRWHSVAREFAPKAQYTMGELLVYADADFVFNAYRAVLRRGPDDAGLRHFLSRLRAGHTSKVEVLGDLRWSPEGQARGVHVDGLLIPYTLWRWKRKRFIGPVIRWIHAFVRLGSLADRQFAQASGQVHETHELGRTFNQLSEALKQWKVEVERQDAGLASLAALEAVRTKFEPITTQLLAMDEHAQTLSQRVQANEEWVQRQTAAVSALPAMKAKLDDLEVALDRHFGAIGADSLEAFVAEARQGIKSLGDDATVVRAGAITLAKDMLHLQQRIDHLQRVHAAQPTPALLTVLQDEVKSLSMRLLDTRRSLEQRLEAFNAGSATEAPLHNALDLDPLYAAFEDRFRGDRALVRRRAEPYLEWMREVSAGTSDAPVLDIGCGRGEWLELLRDNGLVGRGIDLNRVFADICRGYGLDVTEGDAIAVLTSLSDGSIGAITSMHLVEHLAFEQVIVLLDEARRVLRSGGLLVLETPNPENLSVGSHTFYMDPTHRNPIPPEALRWIVEARGFRDVRIERLTAARDLNAPPLLPEDMAGASSINPILASLNTAPDYAIVARKL